MKIEESCVVLQGQHRFESECTSEVYSQFTFRTVLDHAAEAQKTPRAAAIEHSGPGEKTRLMLAQLIAQIVALLSGQQNRAAVNIREVLPVDGQPSSGSSRASEFSWESVSSETVREHESSDFSASGEIRTNDGKSIGFKLDLAMCRDYQCEHKVVESSKAILRDPLVINFDGKAAELTDASFSFDLDGDGQCEVMHALAGGSAFLALDRNGDGRINDGSELFGTRSGNGFADLALLDSDGNHWLDEADAGFALLKTWSRDGDGKETMSSLKDQGVGAIYLGSTETPFSLKDQDNRLRGQVVASGLYLREDGRAGSLQQIDLAV